ncbi:MAG: hypothetical protein ACXABY_12120 [Candidatus Thorarchaeota archaeon]|jgi:hypothetical protein
MSETQLEEACYLLRCALADLENVIPEEEPTDSEAHSGWLTIREIREFLGVN